MKNVLIVYASSTGNTEKVAAIIKDNLAYDAKLVSVNDVDLNEIELADLVLFGSSTWGFGNLQDDFEDFIENFSSDLLAGKDVAVFGCGDSIAFGDAFCQATDIIKEKAEACGANIVLDNLRVDGEPEDNLQAIQNFAKNL